tara:strand:+ start:228 stop:866 length:639 start_codon:yes stop_codon:yes gene_type:complete
MIITIDGPAASGKGTLSKLIANKYNLDHLDTGILYRKVAFLVISKGINFKNKESVVKEVNKISNIDSKNSALRSEKVSKIASIISNYKEIRYELLIFQRSFASHPPGGKGAVLEGRDIGTIICPDAKVKLFVDASLDVRAIRRYKELKETKNKLSLEDIKAGIRRRDLRDKRREISPLIPAKDAHLINTTNLDIEGTFSKACKIIDYYIKDI